MKPLLKVRFAFGLLGGVTLVGCGSETTTGPTIKSGEPVAEAVSPTSIEGVVGQIASPAPTIRVTDSKTHKPLANIPVEFRVFDGVGSVAKSSVVTDASGMASAGEWTFGRRTGLNYLEVYVNQRAALQFSATLKHDVPDYLVAETPIDQAGFPGAEISGPAVYVYDRYRNPVPDAVVTFAMTDQFSQSLERATWVSDVAGRATSGTWTLGTTPGPTHAMASAPGVGQLVFNAQILEAAAVKWYRLDSVRIGVTNYPPGGWGITEARIGITDFDRCLCKKQEGFFVEELTFGGGNGQPIRDSGRYALDGATLTISSSKYPGTIENGQVLLKRPDPDLEFLITLVYKEVSS